MITTEPDRDRTVNLGDKYYRPIKITVEYQQDFPRGTSDKVKDAVINVEDVEMLRRLDSAVHEHMTHVRGTGENLHENKIELIILKPIKNGK